MARLQNGSTTFICLPAVGAAMRQRFMCVSQASLSAVSCCCLCQISFWRFPKSEAFNVPLGPWGEGSVEKVFTPLLWVHVTDRL